MRPLRWKSRYLTGDTETDRRNRAFVDCLNTLIAAAGQREHCKEMDDFVARLLNEAEQMLLERPEDHGIKVELAHRLVASLPLAPYGDTSCRTCGLCDLAQEEIAEHMELPARCLFEEA